MPEVSWERVARLEAVVEALEKRLETYKHTAEVAILKADTANEKRFENVNEWRRAYDDLARQKVGRDEADMRFRVTQILAVVSIVVSIGLGLFAIFRG